MLLAVCTDEFLHGSRHPRVERAAPACVRGRGLERELQGRVDGVVIRLHDLELMNEVNGFWAAEDVVAPGLRPTHPAGGHVGFATIPVGLGSKVGPATVVEQLLQSFEMFGS